MKGLNPLVEGCAGLMEGLNPLVEGCAGLMEACVADGTMAGLFTETFF